MHALALQIGIVQQAIEAFIADLRSAVPRIVAGIVFLILAAILIKAVVFGVRLGLRRGLPGESPVYHQFVATIVAVFLWFAVGLSFLSIVGLDGIAASLGTAAGFLALGVSYALSEMIADAVAGVYLLRDPDFMPGDRVTVDDTTGKVASIELRKTRLDVGGDTVVRGNAEIENNWTKLADDTATQETEDAAIRETEDMAVQEIDDAGTSDS